MHLLYFYGSTLQWYWEMGKIRFLDALNPGGMFDSLHMVNLDLEAERDEERASGRFRFTAIGLRRRGMSRWSKLRALRDAVNALIAGQRPSLVLADDANLLGLLALWVAWRVGCPYGLCVYYDNDLHYQRTRRPALGFLRFRWLETALERFVLSHAAGVYAGNRTYRDYGLRHGARPERAYLGILSVDDIFYQAPVRPHPDGRELFFVGRLHALKVVEDVLEALRDLPESINLDIAGDGPERAPLEALAETMGLMGRVRFLGVISREEVLARMQAARVLVLTQGFSAAVEGLLSGRPVVAYDYECNAEVVRDGDTGLLVPYRDAKGLAQAITRLLGDPPLAERLGRRGRERMIQEYGIAASIEHRRRFFLQCLQP